MPNSRKVTVELTEAQLTDLNAAVDAGQYATTGAILQEAVSEWQIRHTLNAAELRHLQALWDEGRADGLVRPFDIERILGSARARKTSSAAE